ncbi:MAG: 6-bladed beta-propeller [Gemmatimonadetes bacterium]|nr:6-bladed beta-propeller [Gemmatimonadota bacterium]
MMAIFNLRRVFLPIAVGIPQNPALRKSRFMSFSTFTFNNVLPFFRAMLITWVVTGYGGVKSVAAQEQLDESSIPKVPVEYAGEMGLEFKRTVELIFDKAAPGIGQIRWMGITPDSSLLLTDRISRRAYEFSLNDGQYIRSFGRTGKGPGEYGGAEAMAMDSKGDVYIMDPIYGQLLHYNRQGQYRDNKMSWVGCRGLLINRDDALIVMENKHGGSIMQIQKITGLDRTVEYTTPLSSKADQIISCYLRNPAQLCYNTTQNRLYYLEANDYMVKEIDASTGDILRQFGALVPSYNVFTLEKQQPDFKFLPREYHGLDCGSTDRGDFSLIMSEINRATSMVLIDDRYLLISHTSRERPQSPNEWTLYDLVPSDSSELIEAYSLNGAAYQSLEGIKKDSQGTVVKAKASRIGGRIASWKSQIYVYRPPPVEAAEKSNGTVDIYELFVKR